MHRHLLVSAALVLAAGLGLASFGAQATPITVDLSGCGGLASCTNSGVTFTGWQNNSGTGWQSSSTWASAKLTYKADSGNETGLGVACFTKPGAAVPQKCSEHEINDLPQQFIAVDLSGIDFTSLSLGVSSVDCNGSKNCKTPEIAYVYAATCADASSCVFSTLLGSYTGKDYPNNAYTFTFTSTDLAGNDFLWITPMSPTEGRPVSDANILLASLSYDSVSVPEPAVLGMFGLGVLLIGLFTGLRRRVH